MASNTPNLNLLKKDPVEDGADTFNIQTMLNENWDKIDAAVGQLEEDMQEIDIPLSDATNGTRSGVAGSEKAVGLAMQAANAASLAAATAQATANQAFQAGNERKTEIVDALIALGVTASTSDSWDTLIGKMASISAHPVYKTISSSHVITVPASSEVLVPIDTTIIKMLTGLSFQVNSGASGYLCRPIGATIQVINQNWVDNTASLRNFSGTAVSVTIGFRGGVHW